ncbi:MAG: type VI secretion system accessory protein TagJ [Candidatus Krumholzibacteriia bacterium]
MDLQAQLDGGDLAGAVAACVAAVKARPGDADSRYRLFAVLCFAGDLHRARKQLTALDVGDPELTRVQAIYINLLASEQERRAVYRHGAEPLLPPDPPEHLVRRLAALAAAQRGEAGAAGELVAEAIGLQPELAGSVNGQALGSLRDLDDQLGSLLEVFAGGRYLWLPLERIARLEVEPPRHLLDLLWLPARLTDPGGATANVHLPVLYEGSGDGDGDPRCATGRVTEWYAVGGGLERGRGQRLLGWSSPAGEVAELPILELRSLELGTAP